MPTYVYENSKGKRIEKVFPIGKAPQSIGKFERVLIFPKSIQFKGAGWAGTEGKERFKVSWDEVEKITKESDRQAKEAEGKKRKAVKEHLLDTL